MIKKLPEQVINQIAAGEVVERPASVLKELIENSIDASSSQINIYIEDSGIKKIQIIDNGVGIERKDLENLFIKHTTSKISDINDLYNIKTFGFRGEALATIASVSKLKLQTKHQNDDIGSEINVIFGSKQDIKPSNITVGTNILVEDLFANVPVRRKFLRTEATESKINNEILNKYLLSNPEISFYIKINDVVKNYPKEDLIKRVSKILKIQENNLIEVKYNNFIWIYGFILHPEFLSTNKKKQYVFVNKRPVVDQIISKAITDGLDTFIMKNQQPCYVIFLGINPKDVDVNVHPRKTEVRFRNNHLVYSEIKTAINKTITTYMQKTTHLKILRIPDQNFLNLNNNYLLNSHNDDKKDNHDYDDNNNVILKSKKTSRKENKPLTKLAFQFNESILNISKEITLSKNEKKEIFDGNVINGGTLDIDTENITQLLNSYIVTANSKSLIIIDQHAASEKVLYEKYIKSIHAKNIESNILLFPILIECDDAIDIQIIKEKRKLFNNLGFDFEEFGLSSIKITKTPSFIRLENFEKVFKELVSETTQFSDINNIDDDKIIRKFAASLACHSAIRFGDKLHKKEMVKLIIDLMTCENPYNCPHGRPIILEYNITDIEKKFKRCI